MDKPSFHGGPPSAQSPASLRPDMTGQERSILDESSFQPSPTMSQNLTPDKSQTEDDDGEYDSNREECTGMDMLDRASAGRPVVQDTKSESGQELQQQKAQLELPQSIPTPTSPIL